MRWTPKQHSKTEPPWPMLAASCIEGPRGAADIPFGRHSPLGSADVRRPANHVSCMGRARPHAVPDNVEVEGQPRPPPSCSFASPLACCSCNCTDDLQQGTHVNLPHSPRSPSSLHRHPSRRAAAVSGFLLQRRSVECAASRRIASCSSPGNGSPHKTCTDLHYACILARPTRAFGVLPRASRRPAPIPSRATV
jgi:hypothetical protein